MSMRSFLLKRCNVGLKAISLFVANCDVIWCAEHQSRNQDWVSLLSQG